MTDRASVIVVFNNDTKPATVEFDVSEAGTARGRNDSRPFRRGGRCCRYGNGLLRVTLPARSSAIFVRK